MASSKTERGEGGVSLTACVALVIANIVGTGVFTSLGFQLADLRAGFPIIVLWLVGGLFALCGALCYAELAGALPRSGGEYRFLSAIYHPALGFMAGVTSATVGFAAPVAIAGMAFGSYAHAVVPALTPQAAAFGVVAAATLAHAFTLRLGSIVQVVFTALKLALIAAFVVAGCVMAEGQPVNWMPEAGDAAAVFSAPFAVALMFVMYSYSGWNAAVYIAGEVRDAARTVGRALLIGTGIVTLLYVVLNAVFLHAAPAAELRGHIDVGHVAARWIFGGEGGRAMAALIALGLISTISAMTWAGPRVTQAMGEDFQALNVLGRTSAAGIPRVALVLQTGLVFVLLATSTFESAVIYAQFTLTLCAVLTVAGVLVLRWRKPALPRPFRCPWLPLPPLIFIGIGVFTLGYALRDKPAESLAGFLTLLGATALYWFVRGGKTPAH